MYLHEQHTTHSNLLYMVLFTCTTSLLPIWAMKGLLELQNTLKLLRLRGKGEHLPPYQLYSIHHYSLTFRQKFL